MVEQKRITFNDLSGWLKTLVILGWIYSGFYALLFLIGFLEELTVIV